MATSTIFVHQDVGLGNFISVRGAGPLRWDVGHKLECVAADSWRITVPHSTPFEFKALLNDQEWSIGGNELLQPGQVKHVYPAFWEHEGWVSVHPVRPEFQGRDYKLRIYHPPGFGQNDEKRYPVLYCLDGQNLFDRGTSRSPSHDEWMLDEAATGLILAGLVEPLIIVGIDFQDRNYELTPWANVVQHGGGGAAFAEFLVNDVKSIIDQTYPTLPGAESTGVMGSSLGGLFALYAGRRFPQIFTRVAALSPSLWWNSERLRREIEVSQRHDPQLIYLDAGTREGDAEDQILTIDNLRRVAAALEDDGWVMGRDLLVREVEGGYHSEEAWSQRLDIPLRYLFGEG